jgi:hypothetical protein
MQHLKINTTWGQGLKIPPARSYLQVDIDAEQVEICQCNTKLEFLKPVCLHLMMENRKQSLCFRLSIISALNNIKL